MISYKPGIDIQNINAPLSLKDYQLIAFDMDSTLIDMETIDEIATAVDKKEEVAAITKAAMRGEITDYKESLRLRIALLKGVPVSALEQVQNQRMRLNPGAQALVQTAQQCGLKTMLVSGGFTFYTDKLKEQLKLDFTRANVLDIHDGKLTGHLIDQDWGDICDGEQKKNTLKTFSLHHNIPLNTTIAMGDGANDLPMMRTAGLSVAYHAKPIVRQQAHIAINEGGLDRLLEVVLP